MDNSAALPSEKAPIRWFEDRLPVRGYELTLPELKTFYEEIDQINKAFGNEIISNLDRNPDMDEKDWEDHKNFLLDDAFCLTITIRGDRDQLFYGEDSNLFLSGDLPNPINSIFFTNVTAWKRHASNTEPPNRISVYLDFSKPPLLDASSVLSEATRNESNVAIRADDITFFRAALQVVEKKLLIHRTWHNVIHRSFAYDAGVWLFALPAGLIIATFYMEKWLPVGSGLEAFRWAFFLYSLGVVVLGYRFLSSYVKWAFPVNVLKENKDKSLRHRIALGGIFAWLFYKAADAIYGLLPFSN